MLLGIWAILAIVFAVLGFTFVVLVDFFGPDDDFMLQPGEEHLQTQVPGLIVPTDHH